MASRKRSPVSRWVSCSNFLSSKCGLGRPNAQQCQGPSGCNKMCVGGRPWSQHAEMGGHQREPYLNHRRQPACKEKAWGQIEVTQDRKEWRGPQLSQAARRALCDCEEDSDPCIQNTNSTLMLLEDRNWS